MQSDRQSRQGNLPKIRSLADELSSSVRLSFAEPIAGAFHNDAKTVIARTRRVYQTLVMNLTEYGRGTPGIETLLDNSHMIGTVLTVLTEHWRRKETLRLPQIVDDEGKKRPRVYLIARALVRGTEDSIDRGSVTLFLRHYQRKAPLSIRELDIFPDMLRFALIEELTLVMEAAHSTFREIDEAERWLTRMVAVLGRRDAENELATLANQLAQEHKVIPVHFGFHILQRIAQSGRERDLRVASRRLKLSLARQGVGAARLPEIIARSERGQAVVIDRVVAGLHWLGQMRWDRISPPLNAVDTALTRDPAGVFSHLTDETKAAYRRAVVRIADRSGAHDVEVAREVLRLARTARTGTSGAVRERLSHVGHYLVGGGVAALERAFHYEPGLLERARGAVLRHATLAYLGTVLIVTAGLAASFLRFAGLAALPAWAFVVLCLAGLVLASEIAVAVAHLFFTRLIPPRPLPQIDCKKGIGASRRTVVVMPSFFRDARSTRRLLSRLETNFIANNDPDVHYAALLDFGDASAEVMPDDDALVESFKDGIARLNDLHPSAIPRFSLFYRKRVWNPNERVYMGWERKRGKLREFNGLLRGKKTTYTDDAVEIAEKFGHVRYVLTIDEDTELTRDSAQALVGTIDHPLNQPIIDPARMIVTEGYGIIMPRSALRFGEGAVSAFARIFGGFPGIEPYSSVVSDLHLDLFGQGIYQGKGVYDVDAFEATMAERIPENTVLSHDLLEGLYARAGTAANAHIFEGFPSTFRAHMWRTHRWIRGDWQIIQWLFPARGGAFPVIGRWLIADNLRRSLLPVAMVIAVTSALLSPADSLFWSAMALTALGAGQLLPSLARVLGMIASTDRRFTLGYRIRISAADMSAACAKTLLLGVFAMQQAFVNADAVARSMWRLFVTKRKLLEWQTAYETGAGTKGGIIGNLAFMWPSIAATALVAAANLAPGGVIDRLFVVWSAMWVSAPIVGTVISRRTWKTRTVSSRDRSYLHTVAAKTYWFFADMVTKESQWLPPDHFQEEPASKRHSYGLGVSPTNLGMYLLSLSAARKMGLTTVTQYGARITNAFRSMARLERYRGHFYNWYELRALKPITPRYVSSVDSANLALVFLTVRNALREACDDPVVTRAMFDGFDAELSVLSEWASRSMARSEGATSNMLREAVDAVTQSRALVRKALAGGVTPRDCDLLSSGAVHHAVRIRNTMESLRLEEGSEALEDVFLAARHIEALAVENREFIDQYLSFAVIPVVSAVTGDKDLRAAYTRLTEALTQMPSINGLADGQTRQAIERVGFAEAIERSSPSPQEKEIARAWYGEVLSRLAGAEDRARKARDQFTSAADASRRYYDEMDFSFLYDEERGLFHMGYNATREFFDDIFYDLFASEANSVSIVGVAKKDAPKEHWSYLSRKLVRSSARAATPVSWAGSLFEYLGTMLYFDIAEESFWGISARRAIAAHRHFARRLGIPWGMGESASSSTDASGNFHYQAFGEPSIGFKRNLSESVVVAPYTTALALPIVPRLSVRNFHWLSRIGASGRYGFYDAVDYTAYSGGAEAGGVPVRIYYAHHQGFILASIANIVLDGWVRRMIAAEPDMKVTTQLFEEKMPDVPPVELLAGLARPKPPSERVMEQRAEPRRRYVSSRPKEAQWNYLSNGRYRVKISSAGAGESRFGDIDITRPNDGPLGESQGIFHYLYDRERGAMWSPTHMPTRTAGEKSSVSFSGQIAVFEKTYEGITTSLAVAVDPKTPVEVRELTLTNNRETAASLSIGSCAEIALTRPNESLTHHNFHSLFVSSEPAFDGNAVVVTRSDARNSDRSAAAVFFVTTPEGRPDDLRLTRGRTTFYGPLIDRAVPPIMKDPGLAREDLPKHALDTATGFVTTIVLRPGETRSVSLVLAAGETRDAAIEALRPYRKYRHIRKVVSEARQAGASALAALGIPAFQAEIFDGLASLLASRQDYASPELRTDQASLVDVLWKSGISGNRPIVLLSVFSLADLPLVRQMLTCHVYFVHKGIEADTVILNEHRGGYLKTLEDEIDFLLRVHRESGQTHVNRMFNIRADDLDMNEITRLHAAATIRIESGAGSLAEQLRAQSRSKSVKLPSLLAPEAAAKGKAFGAISRKWEPTDGGSLEFWNGFGGYDRDSGEYVIAPKGGVFPPTPWSNIVANEHVGFLATDRGAMFSWSRNSRDNKLTRAYNDPLSAETAEALYVRDELTGEFYSPLPAVGARQARYEVRHGQGYTEYRTHQGGLLIRLTVHIAANAAVKYYSLSVKNDCAESRPLMLFGYFELLIGNFPHETKKQIVFGPAEGNSLIARNAYRNVFTEGRVFAGISGGADQFTTNKEEFIGRFGSLASPAALARQGLSSRIAPDGEPAAAFCRKETLAPGEEKTTVFFLGEATSSDALPFLLSNSCRASDASDALTQAVSSWRSYPKLSFDLPDRSLALLCDRFLSYQTVVSRLHARAGFYQIGGAFGFRDQLQDVLALLWNDPAVARAHILTCATHQFPEGDVLSWWHAHNDFGARTMLSDQHLWLPYAVARYVEFTGDAGILDEIVPYLEGEAPDSERRSVVGVFRAGSERGTLYEHCVRAVERGLTAGAHGLPLIGTADWNDSMNRVGSEGRGESVWLAWFNVIVLRMMAGFSAARGDNDQAGRYRDEVARYLGALERFAWDGSWYRRAYTDAGVPVGTRSGKSWRIDSISQSWATFALGKTSETESALLSAKQEFRIWEGHVPLAWPPSNPDLLDLGTLSDYPPGVRENAGQYNHAALWLAQAMFIVGDADGGKLILDAVNPLKRSETTEKALVYGGEPYAVAADIYSEPTFPGRAGWTWYTASSGVLYRTVVEYLLGLKMKGGELKFEPSFPSDWNEATVRYAFKTSNYVIRFAVDAADTDGAPVKVSLDGKKMEGATISLRDDGKTHNVSVQLSRRAKEG